MARSLRAATEVSRLASESAARAERIAARVSLDEREQKQRQQEESKSSSSAIEGNVDVSTLDEIDLHRFVKDVHREVQHRRTRRQTARLREALSDSRDEVLRKVKDATRKRAIGGTSEGSPIRAVPVKGRVYKRLPSNRCPRPPRLSSVFCLPCADGSWEKVDNSGAGGGREKTSETNPNKKIDSNSVSVKLRGPKNRWTSVQSVSPVLYLEGTHEPLPRSSATIYLKTHYFTEDEQNLTYVPYFGDDDKEDVVSDVFDLAKREKMMEFGPEYLERDTNDVIDETIRLLAERTQQGDDEVSGLDAAVRMNKILAAIMDVKIDRIRERYKACIPSTDGSTSVASSSSSSRGSSTPSSDTPGEHTNKKRKQSSSSDDDDSPTSVRNSSVNHTLPYEDMMDSYRNLFCRRCFSYDCNFHGNLPKPNLDLQGELAVEKEREGYWEETENVTSEEIVRRQDAVSPDVASSNGKTKGSEFNRKLPYIDYDRLKSNNPPVGARKRSRSLLSDSSKVQDWDTDELTPLQTSICERAFLAFQGDVTKIANAIGSRPRLVAQYVADEKMVLKEPTHVQPEIKPESKKKKVRDIYSMRNYNVAWLKRVEDAEIHPAFIPCDHDGPCSEKNCSCVQNAFFCTKHCVWGAKSRNFFRGCACKGNRCRTKSCSCFAAKRECDPDLCRTCGACTDPPNQQAATQKCRNDNIGMRRHCHLLLAKSSIEDAGWGIYTKSGLKKGDFVHEYVGEVISQEEAERRGRIYDKVNRSYLFNLSSDYVVDASRKGNKTKFANHSSKPNCYTRMVSVNGDIRIGLFAKEDIEPQSELFFDYRYDVGMDNDLITKPGKTVDWMKNPKMANKISKKHS